jgi:beta-galactosidase
MAQWTRRDWLKTAASAGGAALLPNVTGVLGWQGARGSTPATQPSTAALRERLLADFGWHFHLGHANDPALDFGYGRGNAFAKSGSLISGGRGGVASATFTEADWKAVDLPHDWAIDLPFIEDRNYIHHGAKPLGRAFPETSIGWYRRTFDIPAADLGRRISLQFDGIFRDAIVILNNFYVGRNLSGYAPFRFDVTDLINYATRDQAGNVTGPGRNTLLIRADATESEGWFYEGAGIYRHVWLEKTAPLHVAHEGTFVTSDVKPAGTSASIETDVINESDDPVTCHVTSTIVDADGKTIATASTQSLMISAWKRQAFAQKINVPSPRLWSIETPHVYKLVTTVETAKGVVDRYETPFGIRTLGWDANTGFSLNGKPVKIKGMCNHQDHAGVGAALPDRLQYFRIEKLKEMGVNAYRTSHNPPTAELLDACDRLGMLVLDETRMMSSNDEGLSQLERLVRRDRNHPCVFAWSIGNEEPAQGNEVGAREAATMKRLVKGLDPTRLVTEAMNGSWGRGLSAVVDIQGFNYGNAKGMDDYHTAHPQQFTMGTEVASTVSTRGIYENDATKGYVSAYDVNHPTWATTAEDWWSTYDARPWVAGGFVWTGFDYRGEPTTTTPNQFWPCISSHFGILDTCGFPKDLFYYYEAWWTSKPVLHLFPHWNWAGKEGQEVEVWCFTNLDSVELFVNGKSAGALDVKKNSHVAWKVPYAAGYIEARGIKAPSTALGAGQPVIVRRETTGAPAKIVLRPDRMRIAADGEDLSVIEVRVVDGQGRVVPTAGHEITFSVTGPGKIIGVGNGDPSCHEPDRGSKRSAFNGLCMALVQGTKQAGAVTVSASAAGLESATATVTSAVAAARAAL